MKRYTVLLTSIVIAGCFGGDGSSVAAPVDSVGSMKACIASVADAALRQGMENAPIPAVAKPEKGAAFIDPTYKTCLVRATAHDTEDPQGFARNDYSRRQAFNADNTRFIVYAFNGLWHLYDAESLAWLQALPGLAADAEPQWSDTDPDKLMFLPINGLGMTVNELTVSSGGIREVGNLADRLRDRWPTAAAASTRSEGAPSRDGRYWAFQVDDAQFQPLGIITWDRVEDRIIAVRDTPARPDHLSMGPSGRHVVVSWDARTVAYDRALGNERLLQARTEHSDLGIGANGNDVYVSIDYGSNEGWIFFIDLETGKRTNLVPTYLKGSATAMHFSAKGYERPGWVLVSTYARTRQQEWLHDKIFIMELAANPRIIPLAHHHTVDAGYWTEPQASVSRDFSRVLFSSNWGVRSETDVDAYYIRLPASVPPR